MFISQPWISLGWSVRPLSKTGDKPASSPDNGVVQRKTPRIKCAAKILAGGKDGQPCTGADTHVGDSNQEHR